MLIFSSSFLDIHKISVKEKINDFFPFKCQSGILGTGEAAESMDTGLQHPQGKNHQVTVRFTLKLSVFRGLMFYI